MLPTITVWRRGQVFPADLPSGTYTFIYRVPRLMADAAEAQAWRMIGKRQKTGTGTDEIQMVRFDRIQRPWSLNTDFQFQIRVYGGSWIGVMIAVAAIAVALGIVAIFTEKTAVEVRKILESPGGQEFLVKTAGGANALLVIGALVLGLGAVGAILFAVNKSKAVPA